MKIAQLSQSSVDLSTASNRTESVASSSQESIKVSNSNQNTQSNQDKNFSPLDEQSLDSLSKKLNEQMEALGANIHFAFSDELKAMYIKVTEKSTGRVIRQIPSEEALKLMEHFRDVVGLIFNKES